jgi:elongation factor P
MRTASRSAPVQRSSAGEPSPAPAAQRTDSRQRVTMKIAQEIRPGNVIMHGKDPMVVLKSEYSRGGRNAATVRMKLKSLLSNSGTEVVFKADDKMEQIILDKKDCTYSYFADPMYVFMDADYNQYEVEAENMGDALSYLEDGMPVSVVFYEGRAISVELPTSLVREVIHTEPAVKGDTSGKVLKPAKISTGFEIPVPIFVNTGDKIEIDTRTHEYKKRV